LLNSNVITQRYKIKRLIKVIKSIINYLKEKTSKDRDQVNRNFKTIKEYVDNMEDIDNEKCWLLINNDDKRK